MLTYDERQRRKVLEARPVELADWSAAAGDVGAVAFGLLALAALVVSAPATYHIMARYHTSDELGVAQAVASLVVFELGAVVSKLATLIFPWWRLRLTALQIGLLLFVAGANALATTAAAPAGETLQALAFAGLLPFFQFVFLALAVARVKALAVARLVAQERREPSQAERLAVALAEAQERQFKHLLANVEQSMAISVSGPVAPAQLPEPEPVEAVAKPADLPRIGFTTTARGPMQPDAQQESIDAEPMECPNCKALLTRPQWLAARRWGHCRACKPAA